MSDLQLFDALAPHIEDALRASIRRFGVLSPVTRDQHGRILDGHHRVRIAAEEGVAIADDVVIHVEDDDEAREIARTLNSDRRHLSEEQRRAVAVDLRRAGHSERAIAGALGVSQPTVHRDLQRAEIDSGESISPERVTRQGGGSYPARRPEPTPPPAPAEPEEGFWYAGPVADEPAEPELPAGQDAADEVVKLAEADARRDAELAEQIDDTAAKFRANFTSAMARSDDVWQFDLARIAEVYGSAADRRAVLGWVGEMRAWCDRVTEALNKTVTLRSVGGDR